MQSSAHVFPEHGVCRYEGSIDEEALAAGPPPGLNGHGDPYKVEETAGHTPIPVGPAGKVGAHGGNNNV